MSGMLHSWPLLLLTQCILAADPTLGLWKVAWGSNGRGFDEPY